MFHRPQRRIPEINASSTADIAFLLLIFFLLTTSMDTDRGLQRRLPPPGRPTTEAMKLRERNVRVALASSSPRSNIREVLAACGLAHAFEVVMSGAELAESKPNPAIYLHTLKLLGLPAEACCCIEDSVPGITAGKRAGLTVIARRETRFGFVQDAADVIVDRVDDVLRPEFGELLTHR